MKKKENNILLINCSLRKDGANSYLANYLKGSFKKKNITIKHLNDFYFQDCISCYKCHQSKRCVLEDDFYNLVNYFYYNEIVIFFCPVYRGGMPGKLKTFIDRTSVLYLEKKIFENKVGGVIITGREEGVGKLMTASTLINFIFSMGIILIPPVIFVNIIDDIKIKNIDDIKKSINYLMKKIFILNNKINN
ncbi:flavodoxin family protein, partial [Patescibacteria group bacterium]|nr:flavodoxin family protein [Patescibacteria group bacterium]